MLKIPPSTAFLTSLCTRNSNSKMLLCNAAAPSETNLSAKFWKGKAAQAIGKPDMANSPDEDLIKAHHNHMEMCNDMEASLGNSPEVTDNSAQPSGARLAQMVTNEAATRKTINKDRFKTVTALVNSFISDDGLGYDEAFIRVQRKYPQLFANGK